MKQLALILAIGFLVSSCGSDEKPFIKFPADDLVRDMSSVNNFSIILYDMDVTEDDRFMHKYKIVERANDAPEIAMDSLASDTLLTEVPESVPVDAAKELGFTERITDWMEVDEADFEYHSSDMGMEIVSKVDGTVSKVAAPPGYSQYVGNEKYGRWQTNSSGDSFWSFYGRYMFISSMFRLMSPVPYGYYSGYGAYRGTSPYYGPKGASGSHAYGTGSSHAGKMNNGYAQRSASNSKLRNKVNSSVSRSSSRATGGDRTKSRSSVGKTGRSSSRYGSSGRSRSSGFGK